MEKVRVAPNGCWEWTAYISKTTGYGDFGCKGKVIQAHRFSYANFKSEDIAGKHVHHICENRRCVNPEHLVALSPADHIRVTPQNRGYSALTTNQCINGHDLKVEGHILKNGRRGCRACSREWMRKKAQTGEKKRSLLKGVYWKSALAKWCAQVTFQRRSYHLGYFDREEDAHDAYLSWRYSIQSI